MRLCRGAKATIFQEGRTVFRRKTVQVYTRPKSKEEIFRSPLLVRVKGLEPSQPCDHKNLNLTRLPIPPHPHIKNKFVANQASLPSAKSPESYASLHSQLRCLTPPHPHIKFSVALLCNIHIVSQNFILSRGLEKKHSFLNEIKVVDTILHTPTGRMNF